jgi:hypothetical protein
VRECRFAESFKSKNCRAFSEWFVTGGTHQWNVAKTPGIENARTMILKFTFFLEGKDCLFVGDAGAEWQTRIWSGDGWRGSA